MVILARKVSILGLSTEWGDTLFQSILCGVGMKTYKCCVDYRSEYTSRHEPTRHSGLEICGSNGSKCYHVLSFATGMPKW